MSHSDSLNDFEAECARITSGDDFNSPVHSDSESDVEEEEEEELEEEQPQPPKSTATAPRKPSLGLSRRRPVGGALAAAANINKKIKEERVKRNVQVAEKAAAAAAKKSAVSAPVRRPSLVPPSPNRASRLTGYDPLTKGHRGLGDLSRVSVFGLPDLVSIFIRSAALPLADDNNDEEREVAVKRVSDETFEVVTDEKTVARLNTAEELRDKFFVNEKTRNTYRAPNAPFKTGKELLMHVIRFLNKDYFENGRDSATFFSLLSLRSISRDFNTAFKTAVSTHFAEFLGIGSMPVHKCLRNIAGGRLVVAKDAGVGRDTMFFLRFDRQVANNLESVKAITEEYEDDVMVVVEGKEEQGTLDYTRVGADRMPAPPSGSMTAMDTIDLYLAKSASCIASERSTWAKVMQRTRLQFEHLVVSWYGRVSAIDDETKERQKKAVREVVENNEWGNDLVQAIHLTFDEVIKNARKEHTDEATAKIDAFFSVWAIFKTCEQAFSPFHMGLFEVGHRSPPALYYRRRPAEGPNISGRPRPHQLDRWSHAGAKKSFEPLNIVRTHEEWANGDAMSSSVLWPNRSQVPCLSSMLPLFGDLSDNIKSQHAPSPHSKGPPPITYRDTPVYPVQAVISPATAKGDNTDASKKTWSLNLDPRRNNVVLSAHHTLSSNNTSAVPSHMMASVAHLPPSDLFSLFKDSKTGFGVTEYLYRALALIYKAIGTDWGVNFARRTDAYWEKKESTAALPPCRPHFVAVVLQRPPFVKRCEAAKGSKPDLFPLQVPTFAKRSAYDQAKKVPALRGIVTVAPVKKPSPSSVAASKKKGSDAGATLGVKDRITGSRHMHFSAAQDKPIHQICLLDSDTFFPSTRDRQAQIECQDFVSRRSVDGRSRVWYLGGISIKTGGSVPVASPGVVCHNVAMALAMEAARQCYNAVDAIQSVNNERRSIERTIRQRSASSRAKDVLDQDSEDEDEDETADALANIPQQMAEFFNRIQEVLQGAPGAKVDFETVLTEYKRNQKNVIEAAKKKPSAAAAAAAKPKKAPVASKGKGKSTLDRLKELDDADDQEEGEEEVEVEEELIDADEVENEEDAQTEEPEEPTKKRKRSEETTDSSAKSKTKTTKKRKTKPTEDASGTGKKKRKASGDGTGTNNKKNKPVSKKTKQELWDMAKKAGVAFNREFAEITREDIYRTYCDHIAKTSSVNNGKQSD